MDDMTDKEFRNFVRSQARQAEFWQRLDAAVKEDVGLTSTLARKSRELEKLTGDVSSLEGQVADARAKAEQIVSDAKREADGIVARADATSKAADDRLADAESVVESAHSDARRIVAKAEAEAAAFVAQIDAIRGKVS